MDRERKVEREMEIADYIVVTTEQTLGVDISVCVCVCACVCTCLCVHHSELCVSVTCSDFTLSFTLILM